MSSNETAIQAAGNGGPVVKIGEYSLEQVMTDKLYKDDKLAQVANIVFPITALDYIPPFHRGVIIPIRVNPNQGAGDIYPTGGSGKGLSKHVILKMLKAAGASATTRRLTPAKDFDTIEFEATVTGKTPDGETVSYTATKLWDWDDIQARCTESEARQQRKFASEICETKALLRAARAWLDIKTSYSVEELQRPFLIAKAVPDLDPNDPEVKRAMIAQATGASAVLYPTAPQAELPAPTMETQEGPDNCQDAEFTHAPTAESEPAPQTSGAPDCTDCGQQIEDVELFGNFYTASQIVDMSMASVYKVPLCPNCKFKRDKARKEAQD